MKTLIKIFLLLLIPAIAVFVLSYPAVWKFRIENILNKKILKDSGWELSIGELSGHLLKEIESDQVEIIHENGTKIYIPRLKTQIDIINSLTGKIHLKMLGINDFYYTQTIKNTRKIFVLPDLPYNKFPLEIDLLTFDGTLRTENPDESHILDLKVRSKINTNDLGLNILIDSLRIKHNDFGYILLLNNTNTQISNREVTINQFSGSLDSILFNGHLDFIQENKQLLDGTVNVNNIEIPEKLFDQIPYDIEFSKINSSLKFSTDFTQYSGSISLTNDIGLQMSGDFDIQKVGTGWDINKVELSSKNATLAINGNIKANHATANLNLYNFNISKWLPDQPETDISGSASVAAVINKGSMDSLKMDLEILETALYKNDTINVKGSFDYENRKLSFSEPFLVTLGESSVITEGSVDFLSNRLDLNLDLTNADVFIINEFWKDSLANGTFSGNVNINGDFGQLNANGRLIGKNVQYKKLILDEVDIIGNRDYADEYLGKISVNINSGRYDSIEFERSEIIADLYTNKTDINHINITNKDDYLIGSAVFNNSNRLRVNDLEILFKKHSLFSTMPFEVIIDSNSVSIDQFAIELDLGKVSGNLAIKDKLNGTLEFLDISSEYLYPLINNDRYKFSGQMFGKIIFTDEMDNQNFNVDIVVKDGGFARRPFEQLTAKLDYTNKLLSISELKLKESSNSSVMIEGSIPYSERKTTDKIKLNFDLVNIDYNTIAQFLPDWFDISGNVNGQMKIDGYGNEMLTEINGNINNGRFERINIGNGSFRANYDGSDLIFNSFASDLQDVHYTGYGYLPIDLNLYSDNFGHFRGNDSLYIFVEGKTNNLEFITKYFDEVDSAPGDYTLALELSGIWDNIIRNGRISANSATINTPLLDDPIKDVNGFIQIVDNQMIIDNLKAKMYKNSRRKSNNSYNVFLSGGMDMTKFFDPKFNINAKGKNVYFRSLIYEMEGYSDFNVSVTGQDTILISGEVAPIDVEMFQALTTSELGVLPSEEGSTIIHYKIDIPIRGKFTLTNDQLDMILIGEISVNQFGDKDTDFAGELIIEDGKFYYYGDVFTIEEGYLIFDGRGFNPYLDIRAYTDIDDERIDISIVGKIDNPTLTFSSESGFSQSDILELLTWRKRFEDQEISSTQLGYQASDRVISWFGSQLDKNILKLAGLDRLGILEDVDVRGTSGLITADEDFSISAPITENMAVNYAYRRSFGLNDSYHSLGLEVRLNRNLSLIGNIDRSGYMHIKYRLRYSY